MDRLTRAQLSLARWLVPTAWLLWAPGVGASMMEDRVEIYRRCISSPARAQELLAADRAEVERLRKVRIPDVAPVFTRALQRLEKVVTLPPGARLELVGVRARATATAFSTGTIVLSSMLWEGGLNLAEDEAAAILAHEIAHVELGHAQIRLCEAVAASDNESIPQGLAMAQFQEILLSRDTRQPVLIVMRRNHGRELEADHRGAELLKLAGYPASAVARMLTKLARLTSANPTWTHPPTETRLEELYMKGHGAPY